MGRALVIQMAKLGDFIQATPLLAGLRRSGPDAGLNLLAKEPAVAEAARLSPLVDEVFTSPEAASASGPFTAVWLLNSHPEAARAAASIAAAEYHGPRLEGGELRFPPAQKFLMSLMTQGRSLGRFNLVDVWASLGPASEPLPLQWPRPPASSLAAAPGRLIGLQLGGRNHLRRWPVEAFAALVDDLAESGPPFTPVLLGSRDEKALAEKFKRLRPGAPVLDLAGATDLPALAGVLARLDLLITGDTGVMHLAAALGVPVLALFFGPAYGPETGPYGRGHLIYQACAPCAPCLENSSCRRRQCLEIPQPRLAALAARQLLAGVPEPFPAVEAPPGHRLWRTDLGAFGQDLYPVDGTALTGPEALALVLTEAGRRVLRPAYEPDFDALGKLAAAYRRPAGPLLADESIVKGLAAMAFPDAPGGRELFLADVRKLSAGLGLKFA